MSKEKICLKCGENINIDFDLHVNLKTNRGKKNLEDVYFHVNCWKLYFEEKARNKATAVIQGAMYKMKPIIDDIASNIRGRNI